MYDMRARVNARLEEELLARLSRTARLTGKTMTEMVREALERYVADARPEQDPLGALRDAGFVGCAEGPVELSSEYKTLLGATLGKKT